VVQIVVVVWAVVHAVVVQIAVVVLQDPDQGRLFFVVVYAVVHAVVAAVRVSQDQRVCSG
jgi:hypothetical protein